MIADISSPLQGTVLSVAVAEGDEVHVGATLFVLESMKMEHVVTADVAGVVKAVLATPGQTVFPGDQLLRIEEGIVAATEAESGGHLDLDAVRADLAEVLHRQGVTRDEARPDAVVKRHSTGLRTARENIADLCDPGSFEEYGSLAIAAQRSRRSLDDLIQNTPADGMVAGIGRVDGQSTAVLSYDYMVLAGTQGMRNHLKKDRLFDLIERLRLPVVVFAEGGGGRPGDTDATSVSGLDVPAFALFARLSGLVPSVGITAGRCFAGNAALLGCCDVIIATEGSNIGMGGPAMIEGGGLGVFKPEDIGPLAVQTANGVVDVAVADEAEAVRVAKQYLSYFRGPIDEWDCDDQRRLRWLIPENRVRAYDVREVITTLADHGSVLELRPSFGLGMITALARIEGRPLGLLANNPAHLGGAIDTPAADKAARFMQLCDAFDLPLVSLCDTPGFMVGPDAETTAQVRHFSRMFVTAASMTVPWGMIILRKGYGLGAQSMAGGSFRAPLFTVAWPTGEIGGMGLEGAVRLGFRRELAAIDDPAAREAEFERLVARAYEHGKALNAATTFELDDVIDPPIPAAGSSISCAPPRRPSPAKARNAPSSTPGDTLPSRSGSAPPRWSAEERSQNAGDVPFWAVIGDHEGFQPSDAATAQDASLYDVDLRSMDGPELHVRWSGRHAQATVAALRHGHRRDGAIKQVEWGTYSISLEGAATRRLLCSVLEDDDWRTDPAEMLTPARGDRIPLARVLDLLHDENWYKVLADVY